VSIDIAVLGSTGTIGENTLRIVRDNPDKLNVVAIAAGTNIQKLFEQVQEFSPEIVSCWQAEGKDELLAKLEASKVASIPELLCGESAATDLVARTAAKVVVAGISGFAGVKPSLKAAERGLGIALANKETIVTAGELFLSELESSGALLVPVDSEHASLRLLLKGKSPQRISKALITASGGPFLERPLDSFSEIKPEEAVAHPNWAMGAKISVDSATMMNKALELIEAKILFPKVADKIGAVIHPQSLAHALVTTKDGSSEMSMYRPDMRVPIALALEELGGLGIESGVPALENNGLAGMDFLEPDLDRFPCLNLVEEALKRGQRGRVCLNAADEVAVTLFLERKIGFNDIYSLCLRAFSEIGNEASGFSDFESIVEFDSDCRKLVQGLFEDGEALAEKTLS